MNSTSAMLKFVLTLALFLFHTRHCPWGNHFYINGGNSSLPRFSEVRTNDCLTPADSIAVYFRIKKLEIRCLRICIFVFQPYRDSVGALSLLWLDYIGLAAVLEQCILLLKTSQERKRTKKGVLIDEYYFFLLVFCLQFPSSTIYFTTVVLVKRSPVIKQVLEWSKFITSEG